MQAIQFVRKLEIKTAPFKLFQRELGFKSRTRMSQKRPTKSIQGPDDNRTLSSSSLKNIRNAKKRVAALLAVVSQFKPTNKQLGLRRKSIRPPNNNTQSSNNSSYSPKNYSNSPSRLSTTPKKHSINNNSAFSYIELLNTIRDYRVWIISNYFKKQMGFIIKTPNVNYGKITVPKFTKLIHKVLGEN
jgi:hypothetical protein